jgi:hypothetical protein
MSIAAPPAGAPGMSAAPAPEAASVPLPAAAPASVEGVAPTVADLPTQKGPKGILFDFNDGCRVVLPEAEQPWRVRLSDLDTGNVLFETELKAGRINSTKRYYVRFRIEVWQQGESVFAHDYSAAGRDVLVRFPVDTLGDPLGWFPYAARFKDRHGCRLTCMMNGKMSGLLRSSYPDINFLTESEIKPEGWAARCSITRIACPATSAASGCTAPPVTSSASIRAKNRRASPLPTSAGRSPILMSVSPCRARSRPNTGTIPPAGPRSCASSRNPAIA